MPDCSIFIYYIYLTLEGPSASIDAIEDFNHCHSPSLCRKILKKIDFSSFGPSYKKLQICCSQAVCYCLYETCIPWRTACVNWRSLSLLWNHHAYTQNSDIIMMWSVLITEFLISMDTNELIESQFLGLLAVNCQ